MRTLQKRGVACVALGPVPNVALCFVAAESQRGRLRVLRSEQGCARYKGNGMFGDVGSCVALEPCPHYRQAVSNVALVLLPVNQRGSLPVLKSEQDCPATKTRTLVYWFALRPPLTWQTAAFDTRAIHRYNSWWRIEEWISTTMDQRRREI